MALRTKVLTHRRWGHYVNGELDEKSEEESKVSALLVRHILRVYIREAKLAIQLLDKIVPDTRPVQYQVLLERWMQIERLIWEAVGNSIGNESQETLCREMEMP